MAGKQTERKSGDGNAPRDVVLHVDGEPVALNGFVMDLFQEVVAALVRSLGNEDATRKIEITVGPAE